MKMGIVVVISIHALLAESDYMRPKIAKNGITFLSTLSLRRATLTPVFMPPKWQNFYPRSPCGERLLPTWELYQMLRISIHALLAESDTLSSSICSSCA